MLFFSRSGDSVNGSVLGGGEVVWTVVGLVVVEPDGFVVIEPDARAISRGKV